MKQPADASRQRDSRWVPMVLFLLSAVFTWLLVQTFNVPEGFRIYLFLALCLATFARQRWLIYLFAAVVLFAASHFDRNGREVDLQLDDLIRVLIFMSYLITSLRYTDLGFRFRDWIGAGPSGTPESDTSTTWLAVRPISSGWLWVPLAMTTAVFVLWVIPYDSSTDYEWQITPTGFRAISVLWLLAVIWFIVSGVFWWMAERETDPLKARVFARSLYCRQLNRELHGIEKRRAARLAKQSEDNR